MAESSTIECCPGRGTAAYPRSQSIEENPKHRRQLAKEAAHENASSNKQELTTWMTSALLTEKPAPGLDHRMRVDHYKGMTAQQLKGIRLVQMAQAALHKSKLEETANCTHYAEVVSLQVANALMEEAEEVDALKRKAAQEVAAIQQMQSSEKQARDETNQQIYTNPPQKTYFDQFGTSHR
eukprot:jgi/Botrbrau1/17981/Bobra.0457s0001.1